MIRRSSSAGPVWDKVRHPISSCSLEGGNAIFRKGAWSIQAPEFVIFDGAFIAENVHSGDAVDLAQKRNLYRVIVGKEGVDLAIEEDRLAAGSRAKNSDIKGIETAIQSHLPASVTPAEFVRFSADPQIDEKIAAQMKEVEAVRGADEVKRRGPLAPVRMPTLPADLSALLGKTLEGIAEDAQRQIADHVARHGMGERGEAWLQQGVDHIVEDDCPYCGQSVHGLPLIEAYRKVFAEAYREMKAAVERTRVSIERDFGDRAAGSVDMFLEANRGATEFWSRYCRLPELASPPAVSTAVSDLGSVRK
jgi:wobble nucleotide-excising tRNase